MKPSHRFILLMLTIALLALAISLPTTTSAQAAPPNQSTEDWIRATLEDATKALGGGFVLDPNNNVTERIRQGVYTNGDPVEITDYLSITLTTRNTYCESYPQEFWQPSTFHGMDGCSLMYGGQPANVVWESQDGLWTEGNTFILDVGSIVEDCYCFVLHPNEGNTVSYDSINILPLAEALHQAAIKNGLYEPMPGEILPTQPSEVVPGQPEVPADTGGNSEVPLGIILGSLGVPVLGALTGAVLSTLLSGLSSAGVTNTGASPYSEIVDVPETPEANDQGLYWSERPWDEAGPGYVSKEEYERTKDMLEQGYKWTNGGWQTPDQITESNQFQQNNRDAVVREDAAWRAKNEQERQALEQNKAELKKRADELQAAGNMIDLKDDFNAINQELLEEKIYVANPYQGDPTIAVYGLNALKNLVWDNTGGRLTGSHGLTCEGYVEKTSNKVIEAVSKRFPGATVQNMIFEEKSTVKVDKSWGDWFDSFIDDNHNLTKIILPDGSEWALDFHQHNAGNAPLLRPWPEARRAWKEEYMGDEFMERVRRSTQTHPKPLQ
ncbi:MAG: hypothetical protein ACYC6R_03525 [Anaerolineales bacterium]